MAKSASNNPSAVLQPHLFSGKVNFQVIADPGHTPGSKAGGSNTKSTSLTRGTLSPTYHPQLFIRTNPWHSALGSVCQAASDSPRAQLATTLAVMVSSPARRAGGRAQEMPSQEGREAAAAGRAAGAWPDLHWYPLHPHILSFSHAVNYSIQLNPGFD